MKNRKERSKKKWVSFLLSGLLILGMMPTQSFAAELQGDEMHKHTDACYEKNLVCEQAETEAHEHTDDCYQTGELICTTEEHTHGDACYTEEKELACEDSTEGHEHSDSCYEVSEVLDCDMEEHSHDDACYAKELNCDLGEIQTHTHTEACYETVLSCAKTETEPSDGNTEQPTELEKPTEQKQPTEQEQPTDQPVEQPTEELPEQEVTEEELQAVDALKASVEEFLSAYDAEQEYSEEELTAFMEQFKSMLSAYEALSPQAQALLSEYAFLWENEGFLLDLEETEAVAVVTAEDGTETPYETLQAAIDAVDNDGTVLLKQDVTETVTVNGQSFTLDMDGYTVTADNGYVFSFTNGEVTLQNGTITGGINSGIKADGTKLTLQNVTLTDNEAKYDRNQKMLGLGGGVYITGTEAELIVEDCTISNNTADYYKE